MRAQTLFSYLFLIAIVGYCDIAKAADSNDSDNKALRSHVEYLTSHRLGGRLTGTQGEQLAAQYIAEVFQSLGLKPAGDEGGYFQEFVFKSGNKKNVISRGRNVLAILSVNNKASTMIVIGAHYDHLGHGAPSNSLKRENEQGLIHPGADDNASGVASLIQVAEELIQLKNQGKLSGNKDILFAAWSGEEIGVLGSTHFITQMKKLPNQKQTIEAVMNLDMVGRLRGKLIIQGISSSTAWPELLNSIHTYYPIQFIMQKDPYLPTDSTPFYTNGIPTLNFFTGAHAEYHTPRDTAETLNYAGIKMISQILVALSLKMEQQTKPIPYSKIKHAHQDLKGELKKYLGTIPDYAGTEKRGLKLAGVTHGSPAELAGVKPGDVIVKLAGKSIHDIYEYTLVLNSLTIGKPVKLWVLRDSKKVELSIIAQSRSL